MQIKTIIDRFINHSKYYRQLSDTTIYTYIKVCKSLFRFLSYRGIDDIKNFGYANALDYIEHIATQKPRKKSKYYGINDTITSGTIASYIQGLRALIRYCDDIGITTFDYNKIRYCKVRLPQITVTDRDTIFRMIEMPYTIEDNELTATRNSLLLRLLYETGCRISEACATRRSNIRDNTIVICGKGHKFRSVCISDELKSKLAQYRIDRRDNYDCLFVSHSNNALEIGLSRSYVSAIVRKYASLIGLKNFTTHGFRHCFATHLLNTGVDIYTIQLMLGHTDIQSTIRYLTVSNIRVQNLFKSYHQSLNTDYSNYKIAHIK